MKILFIISVFGHGRGGHFHSLNHISSKLALSNNVGIITFGPGFSPILKNNPYFIQHIPFNGINVVKTRQLLNDTLNSFTPEIVHFFDSTSYSIIPWLSTINRFKIVLNKCGGPNPRSYPYAQTMIVFSYENYHWFRSRKRFAHCDISLIPNRVNPIILDPDWKPIAKPVNCFAFLRICRIGTAYKKSIEDSIRLIFHLHRDGHTHTRLFVIGTVEDKTILATLKKTALPISDAVHFITNPEITEEASKMLYLADAVVGTGRGFMEAASLGIPVLALNANANYPVLIDQDNYLDAFQTNFSERNNFKTYDSPSNLYNISKLVQDHNYKCQLSQLSLQLFSNYFDIGAVQQKYTECYRRALTGSSKIKNCMISARDFYRFIKSAKKLQA